MFFFMIVKLRFITFVLLCKQKNALIISPIGFELLKQSKTDGFVVGISGGIDSAVTSTLAAKTEQGLMLRNAYSSRN